MVEDLEGCYRRQRGITSNNRSECIMSKYEISKQQVNKGYEKDKGYCASVCQILYKCYHSQ